MGDITRSRREWAGTRRIATLLLAHSSVPDATWAAAPVVVAAVAGTGVGVFLDVATSHTWPLGLTVGVIAGAVVAWRRLNRWGVEAERRRADGWSAAAGLPEGELVALCCVLAGDDYAEGGLRRVDSGGLLAEFHRSFPVAVRSQASEVWWHSHQSGEVRRPAEELYGLCVALRGDELAAELYGREIALGRGESRSARTALDAASRLRAADAVDIGRALAEDPDTDLADLVDAACTVART